MFKPISKEMKLETSRFLRKATMIIRCPKCHIIVSVESLKRRTFLLRGQDAQGLGYRGSYHAKQCIGDDLNWYEQADGFLVNGI